MGLVAVLGTTPLLAGSLTLTGTAKSQNTEFSIDRFENIRADTLALGLSKAPYQLEAGASLYERTELRDNPGATVRLKSAQLLTMYEWQHLQLFVSPGVGLMQWEAKAKLQDKKIGKDDGSSPIYALRAGILFPRENLRLFLEVSHTDDVSGSDLRQFGVGLKIPFGPPSRGDSTND